MTKRRLAFWPAALLTGLLSSGGLVLALNRYDPQARDRCIIMAQMPEWGRWDRQTIEGIAEWSMLMDKVREDDRRYPRRGIGQSRPLPDCSEPLTVHPDRFEGMTWSKDGQYAMVFEGIVAGPLLGEGRGCVFARYRRNDWRIVACGLTWVS